MPNITQGILFSTYVFYSLPQPSRQLTEKGWCKSIGFLGPGIIIASVSIGTGETIFASRSGAIFGYAILWCFAIGLCLRPIV